MSHANFHKPARKGVKPRTEAEQQEDRKLRWTTPGNPSYHNQIRQNYKAKGHSPVMAKALTKAAHKRHIGPKKPRPAQESVDEAESYDSKSARRANELARRASKSGKPLDAAGYHSRAANHHYDAGDNATSNRMRSRRTAAAQAHTARSGEAKKAWVKQNDAERVRRETKKTEDDQ